MSLAATKFSLTVKSTSKSAEQLMIVLNPNLIAPQGVNYETYFPVAWRVLKFTNNFEEGDPADAKPMASKPITVKFDSQLSVILQEMKEKNVVSCADYQPVTVPGEQFEIYKLSTSQYALRANKLTAQGSACILDKVGRQFYVGLGDKDGNSYLTMEIFDPDTIVFEFDAEFAIVPIGKTVEDQTKMVKGSVHKPWYSFKLSDLKSEEVSFTFDGSNVSAESGFRNAITRHGSNEPVFPSEESKEA